MTVVRGDHDVLLRLALSAAQRLAVEQALHYHRSALASFPGLIASRANYDIAQGVDDQGEQRSGVLEQSWRIGGASGAELAALHAFRADPALQAVHAATHEVYGDDVAVPSGARINFDGFASHAGSQAGSQTGSQTSSQTSSQEGRLTKYATVETHGDT